VESNHYSLHTIIFSTVRTFEQASMPNSRTLVYRLLHPYTVHSTYSRCFRASQQFTGCALSGFPERGQTYAGGTRTHTTINSMNDSLAMYCLGYQSLISLVSQRLPIPPLHTSRTTPAFTVFTLTPLPNSFTLQMKVGSFKVTGL